MPESVYIIRNVAKSTSTKIRRFYHPGRARQKQFLGGHRVLHNQQLRISEAEFTKHAPSILDRIRRGIFHVITPDGSTIYADNFGKLKIRKGQDIRDLPDASPVGTSVPMQVTPDAMEEKLQALEVEALPSPEPAPAPEPVVETKPAPAPAHEPAPAKVAEPDFSMAYTEKPEPASSKKGKRR